MLASFLDPATPSLKVCGVTRPDDAERLADMGVDALGANFWPQSKRYLDPETADFLTGLAGRILRVGVFVNAGPNQPVELFERGWIDAVQLHGDESDEETAHIRAAGIPLIKAIGVKSPEQLQAFADYPAEAILLDAHAPGIYGGTGETIDWPLAGEFVRSSAKLPVILAGGITPANAAEAVRTVRPAAIDVASGSESSPGIKDFEKIQALLDSVHTPQR